jgi:hypothetical protein
VSFSADGWSASYHADETDLALAIVRGEITVREVEPEPRYVLRSTHGNDRETNLPVTGCWIYDTRNEEWFENWRDNVTGAQAEADRLNAQEPRHESK